MSERRSVRTQRGVTPIEAAVFVAIAGSVLAVALPAFVRELHASRLTEPVEGVKTIAAEAAAYGREHAGAPLPPSAPLTPSPVPRGVRVVDPAGTWDHPTWVALGFRGARDGAPHAFSFAFDSAPDRFLAHAHGDLDGDGVTSTFELGGRVDATAGVVVDDRLHVEAELE